MSVDCSQLTDIATKWNYANLTNERNETLDQIMLNEDFIAPFNSRYWSTYEFLTVFLIYMVLCILFPIIFYYYFYPKCDAHKRLTFYLKTQRNHLPALRVDIKKLLQTYTKQSDNIINIILDYGDFQLLHKDMNEYIDTKLKSSFDKKKVRNFSLGLWLMITISYFSIFHICVHCIDSYHSYVDIPCVIANIDDQYHRYLNGNCEESDEWDENRYLKYFGTECLAQFDLTEICMENSINLSNYVIYGDRRITKDSASFVDNIPTNCKIHTKTFEYRQPTDTCCGCCSPCGRCNDCCNFNHCCWCGGACDTNACIYCTCTIFIILPLLFGIGFMLRGNFCFEHDFGYRIIANV